MSNEKVFLKPYMLVVIVALIFIFFIASLIVSNNKKTESAEAPASESNESGKVLTAIEERTAPVGEVAVATAGGAETAAAAAEGDIGKTTYDGVCFACHGQGIAGAPKYGDKDAWAARIEQGNDTLYDHAINGFTGPSGAMMPAKGGRADIADADIKAAVDYMLAAVGVEVTAAESSPATEEASTTPSEEAAPAAVTASSGGNGKEVYDKTCFVCHTTGVAGAPKLGDKEAWATRISQGNETLYDHAINGFMGQGMMPPKGGNADLSDDDVKAAVDYMVEKGS